MRNDRIKGDKNYYFSCRKEAAESNCTLSSRLSTAGQLNISEATLRDYEVGLYSVPQDVVCLMSDLYGKPEMKPHYCKTDCPIGKRIGGGMTCEIKQIEAVAVSFLYHTEKETLDAIRKTILQIATTGKISIESQKQLMHTLEYLEAISRDISDLWLIAQKPT